MTTTSNHVRSDRASVRFPPPLVYALSMLLAFCVHRLVLALPMPDGAWPAVVGGVMIVAAIGIGALALERFLRTGQNPEPWTPTPALVANGIYRFTRNPMYLAMSLAQFGFGLAGGILWFSLLTPLSMAIVARIAICPEEAYLAEKFGDDYDDYRRRVRRWL
jgi:protein-S-isoprenylcysteine O-methyltransferase Ste14